MSIKCVCEQAAANQRALMGYVRRLEDALSQGVVAGMAKNDRIESQTQVAEQLVSVTSRAEKAEHRVAALEASISFRVGHSLVRPVGRFVRLFRGWR